MKCLKSVALLQAVVVDPPGQHHLRFFLMQMDILRMRDRQEGGGQQLLLRPADHPAKPPVHREETARVDFNPKT